MNVFYEMLKNLIAIVISITLAASIFAVGFINWSLEDFLISNRSEVTTNTEPGLQILSSGKVTKRKSSITKKANNTEMSILQKAESLSHELDAFDTFVNKLQVQNLQIICKNICSESQIDTELVLLQGGSYLQKYYKTQMQENVDDPLFWIALQKQKIYSAVISPEARTLIYELSLLKQNQMQERILFSSHLLWTALKKFDKIKYTLQTSSSLKVWQRIEDLHFACNNEQKETNAQLVAQCMNISKDLNFDNKVTIGSR